MKKPVFVTVILVFLFCRMMAQNKIPGTWHGSFETNFTAGVFSLSEPALVVEIHDFSDSLFTGISHLYYEGGLYEHYKIAGRFSARDSLLIFKETETINVDLGGIGNCSGTYMVKLSKKRHQWQMQGLWASNIKNCAPTTKVQLSKKEEAIKPPVVIKTPSLKEKNTPPATVKPMKEKNITAEKPAATSSILTNPAIKIPVVPASAPAVLTRRETDVQSLIEITALEKDSIRVDVYDNGDVDGDTVSVYEENMVRINRKMISTQPITFYVGMNKSTNPIAHLRLVAESLGSIPPCTALMIVTTKTKRYEVRLSSNFNKNATVEFFLKE